MAHQITLICLPFAGGSSYSYNPFTRHLPAHIRLLPVDLPGHGKRMRETLCTDVTCMTEAILQVIREKVAPTERYAIFGHSMGSLLGYKVIGRLMKEGRSLPEHFFASGRKSPTFKEQEEFIHRLPSKDFREKLRSFHYTTDEILDSEELMNIFEPILRADIKAVESYEHIPGAPLPVQLTVLTGIADDIAAPALQAWQEITTEPISIHPFNGGHFFIFQQLREVCGLIAAELDKSIISHQTFLL